MALLVTSALAPPPAHPFDRSEPATRSRLVARGTASTGIVDTVEEPADDSIGFRVVRFSEHRAEVLALRRAAFGASRPSGLGATEVEGPELRDRDATLVIAESAGRIVGSVRLNPPLPGPILHSTSRVSGPTRGLPDKGDYLEASRACIHPDHQGKGLFWHLAAHMVHAARAFRRPYLVAGTEERLWRNWRRCGFVKIGATYRRADSEVEYHLVVLEIRRALEGRGIAPRLARALGPLLG